VTSRPEPGRASPVPGRSGPPPAGDAVADRPASTLRCAGCGCTLDPADRWPFRCPRAGTDDTDHVLARVLDLASARFPGGGEANPFLRYRSLAHSHWVALAHGISDAGYCALVAELDAAVAAADGHGFTVTPLFRSGELSRALGHTGPGGVWVKDETGNVSGSHKGRHLMGVMIQLLVAERAGLASPEARPPLAIASCGNAALAAAVVARAAGWPLTVFIPPAADPKVTARLRGLGAELVTCPRQPGAAGDPCYLRLREALAGGALPFTTQGNENGLAIEGGMTLAYELAEALPEDLDHLVIQVGGGALASACVQGLAEAAQLGALARLPRIHTVQTASAHPLERAYHRVTARLGSNHDPQAVRAALAHAARHRSEYMWPWETEPASIATGILDDETYDWRAVVEGMLLTGGQPVVVGEDLLAEANTLATAATGIPVDPTGSAGLAGLLALRRSGVIAATDRAAILFTGAQR
jgi:threonine synthase